MGGIKQILQGELNTELRWAAWLVADARRNLKSPAHQAAAFIEALQLAEEWPAAEAIEGGVKRAGDGCGSGRAWKI